MKQSGDVYFEEQALCLAGLFRRPFVPSHAVNINVMPPLPLCLADIDECVNETICGDRGFCENTDGSFRCQCDQGYTNPPGDVTKCVGLYNASKFLTVYDA